MTNNSQIYSQGYQKWEGERTPALPAWYLIGMAGVRNLLGSSGCLARSSFVIVFVIYYFMLMFYTIVRFQWESLKKISAIRDVLGGIDFERFALSEAIHHRNWIVGPTFFILTMLMVFYGSQLISKDRAANALQVYFSKAVTHMDYVLGKFFAVGVITATTTLIPSALIFLTGFVFTNQHVDYLAEAWYVPLLTIAFWALLTYVFGSLTLFFSSLYNKGYLAAVTIIGFMMFSTVAVSILEFIFGSQLLFEGFNVVGSLFRIGNILYELKVDSWSDLFWRLFDLMLLASVLVVLMFRRIRPVEVVK